MNQHRPVREPKAFFIPEKKSRSSTPGPEKKLQHIFERSISHTFGRRAYLRKTHPDAFEGSGKPDMIGHIFGVHTEIELKVSNNYPTSEQYVELKKVFETGGVALLLIHHQAEDAYFMIVGASIENFSYRQRGSWIQLPHWGDGEDRRLNLTPLGHLIITHGLNLEKRFKS